MLSVFQLWTALGLLVAGANAFYGPAIHNPHSPFYRPPSNSTTTCIPEQTTLSPTSPLWYSDSTITSTTTMRVSPPENTTTSIPKFSSNSTTTCTPENTTLSPTSPLWYSDSTITSTTTMRVSPPENTTTSIPTFSSNSTTTCTPEQTTLSPTSTLWYSDSTITSTTTIRVSPPEDTTTSIPTFSITLSSTTTTTTYAPTTITPYPTTPPNPCPTYCSISAGTVNLFYWPTNEPYTYPSTYVDTHLDYTFTSPSVYMVVNTIFGYNTAGRAGPSGTSVVFALDLDQVSTIVPNESATRQLTLSDLGTNCPQTEAASVIATAAPDGRCDPILVAPDPVKSWASPCNACGAFGLFDPPYAVPPLTGGLVPGPTTTWMAQPKPQTTPSVISATDTTTSVTTGGTSSDVAPTDTTIASVTTEATSSDVTPTPPLSSTSSATTSLSSFGSDPNPTTTPAMAASATKVTGGLACLILSFFVSAYLV